MSEKKYCYTHKNTETRLSCNNCGKLICPKCMINSAVGYKCKECADKSTSHIEKVNLKEFILAFLSGFAVAVITGFIWNFLNTYGLFVDLLVAYIVGFCISRAITKVIGTKISKRIQILAGLLTVMGMFFNPILATKGVNTLLLSINYLQQPIGILALIIAVWAAVRHFKF